MKPANDTLVISRNEAIDCLKGILIFLVCLGHAIQFVIYKNENFWDDKVFKLIYIFHMPLFMAVAGYLTHSGLTKSESTPKYLNKRLISYLVPIFTWAALYQLVHIAAGKITLDQLPAAVIKYATESLWFLWALLGSIFIASIAQATKKLRTYSLIALTIATIFLPEVGNFPLFKYTVPFFSIGFLLAENSLVIPKWERAALIWILVLGFLGSFFYAHWEKNTYIYVSGMILSDANLINIVHRWAGGAILSLLFIILFFYFYRLCPTWLKDALAKAGKDSLYIYIIQGFAFDIALKISLRYSVDTTILPYKYPTAVAIGIAATYFCLKLGNLLAKNNRLAFLLFGK